ncbi:MAG: hypothetical protein MJK08_02085 [Campylobacterales bacterium]|nr:hypothetical protein [Campylobacterales bacterium]
MDKKNKKIDIVKIKGIIGIVLFLSLIIIGKIATLSNLSDSLRYWGGMMILIIGSFSLWLSLDYFKVLFGQDNK